MSPIDLQPSDNAVFERLGSTGRITHWLRHRMTNQRNVCCHCQTPVTRNRPIFAGYGLTGEPLVVGACCAQMLSELATPVYWSDTLNLSFDDGQHLWRYMDFAKFVAMLHHGGLYFPRADQLEDRFEAAVGLARLQTEWDKFYLDSFRELVQTAPPGHESAKLTATEIESEAHRLLANWKSTGSSDRASLVSCWHANDGESEALWRLYCPPHTTGVAVRTTALSLWSATQNAREVKVGRVHYVDFARRYSSIHDRIYCKRSSLSHENEVRAVIPNRTAVGTSGMLVACDISKLVHEVVVSPFSPSWFQPVVEAVIAKFGCASHVKSSELLEEPFY